MLVGAGISAVFLVVAAGTGAEGAEGAPEDFPITGPSAGGPDQVPAVAWNGIANEYLVVWQDGREWTRESDIYGQRVSATGSRIGSNFLISEPAATGNDLKPAVAWNATANEYLVVWEDGRNSATRGYDIYGQRVSATGFLLGSNFRVGGPGATSDDWNPAVAWNGTTRQYLVVWEDPRNEAARGVDIYGQRVSATGSRVGPDFLVSGPGATSDDSYPAVAWNGTANQYLAAWMDKRNYATRYSDVYGQRVPG
jgi:hypothetical protein